MPNVINRSFVREHIKTHVDEQPVVRRQLRPALDQLFDKKVTGANATKQPPPIGDFIIRSGKNEIKTDLTDRLGLSSGKAESVTSSISKDAMKAILKQNNQSRFARLETGQIKELRSQLHYKHNERVGSAEDRLINRAAILNAFAQGASLFETRALRAFLDAPTTSTGNRRDVLDRLNEGPDGLKNIIARHASRQLTEEDSDLLTSYVMSKADLNTRNLGPDKVQNFIDKNKNSFGIDDLQSPKAKIIKAEMLAITSYSNSVFYQQANNALRDFGAKGKSIDKATQDHIDATVSGLAKLPDFRGVVMRGVSPPEGVSLGDFAAKYQPGERVTEHAFTSTSADRPYNLRIQFIIESKHGKEITDLSVNAKSDGREVLFPPGTQFDVIARSDGKTTRGQDMTYIVMKEVG